MKRLHTESVRHVPASSHLCDKRFCLFWQHVGLFSICRAPLPSVHLEVVQLVFFLRSASRCLFLWQSVEPSLRRFLRHQLLGLSGHRHCWLLSSVFAMCVCAWVITDDPTQQQRAEKKKVHILVPFASALARHTGSMSSAHTLCSVVER